MNLGLGSTYEKHLFYSDALVAYERCAEFGRVTPWDLMCDVIINPVLGLL